MQGFLNTVVRTKQKYVSVSRPRRFGKTMAADMICAYYDRDADSRELFEGMKLSGHESASEGSNANWDIYLGGFDVIRLVMTDFMEGCDSVDDMTGILPIKKYGKHSALNMFTEYSMMAPLELAPYTGFTDDKVRTLCKKHKMSFEDISNWYDGYVISDSIPTEERESY